MSELYKLNDKDFLRGLIVTVLSSVLTLFIKLLENKGFNLTVDDLRAILLTGLITGLSYLVKNFATNDEGKLAGKLKIN